MCGFLIPAIVGVVALGALSGGGSNNYTVTIPQEQGIVTNGVPVYSAPAPQYVQADYGYAQPAPVYPSPSAYAASQGYYAAPAPDYYGQSAYAPAPVGPGPVGAGVNVGGPQGVGAGAYAGDGGVGVGANVGGIDAGIGIGARTY